MDFEEPDLEELIQSDLRSEMNKILDQSDNDHKNAASTICLTISSQSSSQTTESELEKVMNSIDSMVKKEPKQEYNGPNNRFPPICGPSRLQIIYQPDQTEMPKTNISGEISGSFSVKQYPNVQASENLPVECLVHKSEHNDLSNLSWLTTVDVQQALQRGPAGAPTSNNPEQFHIMNQLNNQTVPGGMTELLNSPTTTVPFSNQSKNGVPTNNQTAILVTNDARIQTRYTPIQPNPNVDAHQRYMLHQQGGHTNHPQQMTHMGTQRYGLHGGYHAYPPPPYGSPAYMHEGYHHNRFHGQGQKVFPKPVYSYSCLIAMSLKNSKTGCLPVSDIYSFMMENFPYFKTAPDGWKNSVRHNLSLNKCFEKVEKPNGTQRKGCLWALNPAKIGKMEEEVQKWKRKDPDAIRKSMANPEDFDREMEELRRTDEEAARRRMLSMSGHGLSMITSAQGGYYPNFPGQHMHGSTHARHIHPGGSTSLPTTPQHYHPQHNTPYRHAMTPGQRIAANNSSTYHALSGNNSRQPRQLFGPSTPDSHNFQIGMPDISSTPISAQTTGIAPIPSLATLLKHSSVSSTSTTSSSGSSGLFGSLADHISGSGHDLHDIDLDSSLVDLSVLQGSLWDDAASVLAPQNNHQIGGGGDTSCPDAFDERGASTMSSMIESSPSIHIMEQAATESGVPVTEGDVFGPTGARFGATDMSYFGSNTKTVMLH